MGDYSHLSQTGEAKIVDIAGKQPTERTAVVHGRVLVSERCVQTLDDSAAGEICRVARIAGIQAGKQTSSLIPLCHQIPLQSVDISIVFQRQERCFTIAASAKAFWTTGVEMESMVAATIAGTTIYDMIKAVDPAASLGPFFLAQKRGGKAGIWERGT